MLTLTDIQLELKDRAGVEATGIRLTHDEGHLGGDEFDAAPPAEDSALKADP